MRIPVVSALAALPLLAAAQTFNISTGNVSYAVPAERLGSVTGNGVDALTINGTVIPVNAFTKMSVSQDDVAENEVHIVFSDTEASVTIAYNIAEFVAVEIVGAHVSITQAENVGDATCGEITYILRGASADGSFVLEGSYKATIELRGLVLNNPSGAAIDIENGKRIEVSAKSSTVNTISDGPGGKNKAALYCKGHLEFKGKGELNVTGNTAHAISAKEYVEMKNLTLNILGSVKDGINCTQHFTMESGELNILNPGDDALQCDYKDSADREEEDTGTITLTGGTINAAVSTVGCKVLKAEGNIVIEDGILNLSTTAGGYYDTAKLKTKASTTISADEDVFVNGGTLNLSATGSGGKGISCDGVFTMNDGTLNISTSGGIFAYVNGKEYDNYTGNTDNLDSDLKSSPKGVKADTAVEINGGEIIVNCTGHGGEGIESKGTLTINDGQIRVKAYDDCINSSSHMYIKGGNVTVISTGNDGLDSNGNLYMQGGYVMAFGTGGVECGIDANEEEGYSVYFTGGTLLATGGGNSTPSSSASTQAYVSGSAAVSADMEISLKSGSTVLATFTVPQIYGSTSPMKAPAANAGPGGGFNPGGPGGGNAILITAPGITSDSSYTLSTGSTSQTLTATQYGNGGFGGGHGGPGGPGGFPW